jgi:hypothetical protein
MKTYFSNDKVSDNGFIYVASRDRLFYELALLSCESLKSFSPKTHVTLFTHEKFVDDRCRIFDNVIVNIPIHYRTKMWAMARSPYKRTIYNDCDSQICHKDVSKMFDFLDECDLFCGSNLLYTVGNVRWAYIDKDRKHIPKYHGSMWGYHKTELITDFMQTWFDEYIKQVTTPWTYEKNHYPEWQKFDMFTLWRMTSGLFDEFSRFNNLNIKILSRRWNTTTQDLPEDLDGPPVITQIDKDTWRKMPNVWKIIEKGVKDENHQLEKRPFTDPTIIYN